MSRDFSQEYQNYINEQTPDLWARIEANLCEKNGAVSSIGVGNENGCNGGNNRGSNKGFGDVNGKDSGTKTGTVRKFVIPQRYIAYGMTAAAAVLICLIVVPFVGMVISPKGSSNQADCAPFMVAMDTAENYMVEEGCVEDEACEVAPDLYVDQDAGQVLENYTYAETEEQERATSAGTTSGSGSMTDGAKQSKGDSVAGAIAEDANSDDVKTESVKTESAKVESTETENSKTESAETKNVKEEAKIEILSVEKSGEPVIYKATFGAETITFVLSEKLLDSMETELTVGNVYCVVWQKAEEGMNYNYIVEEIR